VFNNKNRKKQLNVITDQYSVEKEEGCLWILLLLLF